jgi:hypothetical protein
MNMSENKKKILEMLAQGKISADEAYRLLSVVDGGDGPAANAGQDNTGHTDNSGRDDAPFMAAKPKGKSKYLFVKITPTDKWEEDDDDDDDEHHHHSRHGDKVNVRVPMSLIRAGIKMKSLIPPEARDKIHDALHDKGIDFDMDSIKSEDIEELIESMGDMEIDIEGKHGEAIQIHVE